MVWGWGTFGLEMGDFLPLPYSFFFRVDVSTDLGGKSAILGAWEENRRKSEESAEIWRKVRKRREKEGERTERPSAKRWKKSAPQVQKKNAF